MLKYDVKDLLCFTLQRYKIESNSQPYQRPWYDYLCCVLHCKDTKLKAIHNEYLWKLLQLELCFTLQRYKIESNSQHKELLKRHRRSCVLHCKDTKLKAIHNTFDKCVG